MFKNKLLIASVISAFFIVSCSNEMAVEPSDDDNSYSEFVDALESTGGKAFAEAPHRDKFLETFIVKSFQVLGDTNDDLKNAMEAYTNDHRTLMNGFQRKNK